MKNYLAIDTSGIHMTVLLRYNGEYYSEYDPVCAMRHGSEFMTSVERLLSAAGAKIEDMDFFACVTGAGSFTGIRIGISAVKAFCMAENKPFLGVTSFDLLAYNSTDSKVLAVVDAKHGAYYVCGYTDGKITYPPAFIEQEELEKLKGEYTLLSSTYLGMDEKICDPSEGLIKAIEAKEEEIKYDLDELLPLYLRKSQAEEGR